MANNCALELNNVTLCLNGRTLIDDISLTVAYGSLVVVTGFPGCGKSSLLNLLSTLIPPSSGTLRVFGTDTAAVGEPGRRALRLDIGVVFEEGALLEDFTVAENVELPLARRGIRPPELTQRTEYWLNRLQLMAYRDCMPHQLSLRLIRRVALTRALVSEPRLLICDEVTTGLDLRAVLAINRLFQPLRTQGTTIIMGTSDLNEVARIADAIAVLNDGRLVFHGTLHQLQEQRLRAPFLREVFDDESWAVVFPATMG